VALLLAQAFVAGLSCRKCAVPLRRACLRVCATPDAARIWRWPTDLYVDRWSPPKQVPCPPVPPGHGRPPPGAGADIHLEAQEGRVEGVQRCLDRGDRSTSRTGTTPLLGVRNWPHRRGTAANRPRRWRRLPGALRLDAIIRRVLERPRRCCKTTPRRWRRHATGNAYSWSPLAVACAYGQSTPCGCSSPAAPTSTGRAREAKKPCAMLPSNTARQPRRPGWRGSAPAAGCAICRNRGTSWWSCGHSPREGTRGGSARSTARSRCWTCSFPAVGQTRERSETSHACRMTSSRSSPATTGRRNVSRGGGRRRRRGRCRRGQGGRGGRVVRGGGVRRVRIDGAG